MLMKERYPTAASDIECYAPPMCFELAGRTLDIRMDGGESLALAFTDRRVTLNGARETDYTCAKITEKILFVSFADASGRVSLVPDLETGAVTRVLTRADAGLDTAFGSIGASPARHAFTDDLKGNTVTWVLGARDESVFSVSFGGTVTLKAALRGGKIEAAGFRAVKIADSVYLQCATVENGAERTGICMVSDFRHVLCAGGIYGASGHRVFGGYGRVEKT